MVVSSTETGNPGGGLGVKNEEAEDLCWIDSAEILHDV